MRDKLIHHYFGVNLEIVWDVAKNKLPELKSQLDSILATMESKRKEGNFKRNYVSTFYVENGRFKSAKGVTI